MISGGDLCLCRRRRIVRGGGYQRSQRPLQLQEYETSLRLSFYLLTILVAAVAVQDKDPSLAAIKMAEFSDREFSDTICLFDVGDELASGNCSKALQVDNTLTPAMRVGEIASAEISAESADRA